jgi:hypothetical protein
MMIRKENYPKIGNIKPKWSLIFHVSGENEHENSIPGKKQTGNQEFRSAF